MALEGERADPRRCQPPRAAAGWLARTSRIVSWVRQSRRDCAYSQAPARVTRDGRPVSIKDSSRKTKYRSDDFGAPSAQPYYFNVKYIGSGLQPEVCGNGIHYQAYAYQYKKGSSSNYPFAFGVMITSDGYAEALTETHNGQAQPTAYFGCQYSANCDNSDYGIQVQNASGGWNLCCQSVDPFHDKPPYVQLDNAYWSFKTCNSACWADVVSTRPRGVRGSEVKSGLFEATSASWRPSRHWHRPDDPYRRSSLLGGAKRIGTFRWFSGCECVYVSACWCPVGVGHANAGSHPNGRGSERRWSRAASQNVLSRRLRRRRRLGGTGRMVGRRVSITFA